MMAGMYCSTLSTKNTMSTFALMDTLGICECWSPLPLSASNSATSPCSSGTVLCCDVNKNSLHNRASEHSNSVLVLFPFMCVCVRRYIPAAIQPALKARHDEHLAEIREVSVLFVKINGICITSSDDGNCAQVESSCAFVN